MASNINQNSNPQDYEKFLSPSFLSGLKYQKVDGEKTGKYVLRGEEGGKTRYVAVHVFSTWQKCLSPIVIESPTISHLSNLKIGKVERG